MDFESLFDIPIDDLHTPCYLTDARLLQKNTALLKQIQQRTGCKILLAQKAFSMFSAYPLIRDDLAGTRQNWDESTSGKKCMCSPLPTRRKISHSC